MKKIYLITSGSYSDYDVVCLMESAQEVNRDTFRQHWLEAVRRKSEYDDRILEAIASYLKVPKQNFMGDYRYIVSPEQYQEALRVSGYKYIYETDFFKDVLQENGFTELQYEEQNTDDL